MTRQNWLYWNKALDVSRILDIASKQSTTDATTFGGVNMQYRTSKVAWLTGNQEIMDMLWPYASAAAQTMGVEVMPSADFQYTEYHGTNNGKYDWHHDVDWNGDTWRDRKLSLTVQLSDPEDYTGGIFEFQEVQQPNPDCRDKGTVLVFPSYLGHRVTPVQSGIRKTLVAWFEGPRWR